MCHVHPWRSVFCSRINALALGLPPLSFTEPWFVVRLRSSSIRSSINPSICLSHSAGWYAIVESVGALICWGRICCHPLSIRQLNVNYVSSHRSIFANRQFFVVIPVSLRYSKSVSSCWQLRLNCCQSIGRPSRLFFQPSGTDPAFWFQSATSGNVPTSIRFLPHSFHVWY